MTTSIRILGVDTALRASGVGVVEAVGSQLKLVAYDVIRSKPKVPLSQCLLHLDEGLQDIIRETQPDAVAIEGAFFFKNARTAMVLGEARGTAITACTRHGLKLYEYAPRHVKQAVVGFGGAQKEQVQKMIVTLLNLDKTPPEDASDALALAICHIHSHGRHAALTTLEPL
ncbi:MAG: crossover junction endodeoxyribonuclease RuvC [Verrucomicrobia bacterium]|jgi:crossover junction endodeoxyribonuclease RuvC|nr:crossover junction endodeoxyribonuclease RuvC [Verrucomicrobiota bacterium]MBT7065388.1 crossover junction endodeoxyribonuclease RuvC [Verrucomicrobiota bacterium]MBT7699208.1 crossover junction endodeoxyribonuclease RuvC [Verrucomicrobiota bacterium]